jgi:transposase
MALSEDKSRLLVKMEKEEFRAVIKHFFIKGFSASEVKVELDSVHGNSAPHFSTISRWINEFKMGRKSTQDEPRSGRPKSATTEENVRKVHHKCLRAVERKSGR